MPRHNKNTQYMDNRPKDLQVFWHPKTENFVKFIENVNPWQFRGEWVNHPNIRFVFNWNEVIYD